MGTIVYLGLPAHGHTNPTLPVIKELVDRGERVVYFSAPMFKEKVLSTGAEYREYRISKRLAPLIDPANQQKIAVNFFKIGALLLDMTYEVIAKNTGDVEALKPDCIIHDAVCFHGAYMAKKLGVKAASFFSTFVLGKDMISLVPEFKTAFPLMLLRSTAAVLKCLSLGHRIEKEFGYKLDLFNTFSVTEDLNIVFTSRHFQPHSSGLDERFRFVGPSISERPASADFPFNKLENKRVVYISLGTVLNIQADFYRKCFVAFGNRDLAVVLSIGNAMKKESLDNIPGNFIVVNYAPQLEVLKKAGLFISHGGMNSVDESLYFGVPLIIIPQHVEHDITARRLKELGAGFPLKRSASPGEIYASAEKILSDGNYRRNAGKIGETFREAGGYKKAADEILQYINKDF